jgi:Ser/Thr protein kinase RdoA (MazF antagonist)
VRGGVGRVTAQSALRRFTRDPRATLEPLGGGLINETWLFTAAAGRGVLQRLNPIFAPEVNGDIDAVTTHLTAAGLPTPRVLRTLSGDLWCDLGDDGVWRSLTYVEGTTLARAEAPSTALEAASLLGRFHRCLATLDHEFAFVRPGVHDTDHHLARLAEVAADQTEVTVDPLARDILDAARDLPALPPAPMRVLHGDPKLDNLRFDTAGTTALCLIDLDTLRRGPLAHDLGDAWRSWCNRNGEDTPDAALELPYLEAAAHGYATGAGDTLSPDEIASLPIGLERIALELAARFCTDAYEDRYFGWNPEKFASRREHNLVRARGQYSLWLAVAEKRDEIRGIVENAFG